MPQASKSCTGVIMKKMKERIVRGKYVDRFLAVSCARRNGRASMFSQQGRVTTITIMHVVFCKLGSNDA